MTTRHLALGCLCLVLALLLAPSHGIDSPRRRINVGKAQLVVDLPEDSESDDGSSSGSSSFSSGSESTQSGLESSEGSESGSESSLFSSSGSSGSSSDSSSGSGSSGSGSSSGSSGSSGSSSGSSGSMGAGMHFRLPPEPRAARGYKPFPTKRPKGEQDSEESGDSGSSSSFSSSSSSFSSSSESSEESSDSGSSSSSNGKPCTENCDALEDKPFTIKGPTVLSMGVGDVENGMKPVKNTQTGSDSWIIVPQVDSTPKCGCSVCPCPARHKVIHHVLNKPACGCNVCPCAPAPTAVAPVPTPVAPALPTTGVSANNANIQAALAAFAGAPPAPAPSASCGCNVCPCPAAPVAPSCGCAVCPCEPAPVIACAPPLHPGCPGYLTPEEIRAKKLELYEEKLRAARELERVQLQSTLENHQDALSKIEQMSRAMKYQYAELRRHHMALRASVSANKQALGTLGNDALKGTEFDIEGPMPRDIDDLSEVPASEFDSTLVTQIQKSLNNQYSQNLKLLLKSQQKQRTALSDFLGTGGGPAVGKATDSESSSSIASAIVSSILSSSKGSSSHSGSSKSGSSSHSK